MCAAKACQLGTTHRALRQALSALAPHPAACVQSLTVRETLTCPRRQHVYRTLFLPCLRASRSGKPFMTTPALHPSAAERPCMTNCRSQSHLHLRCTRSSSKGFYQVVFQHSVSWCMHKTCDNCSIGEGFSFWLVCALPRVDMLTSAAGVTTSLRSLPGVSLNPKRQRHLLAPTLIALCQVPFARDMRYEHA